MRRGGSADEKANVKRVQHRPKQAGGRADASFDRASPDEMTHSSNHSRFGRRLSLDLWALSCKTCLQSTREACAQNRSLLSQGADKKTSCDL